MPKVGLGYQISVTIFGTLECLMIHAQSGYQVTVPLFGALECLVIHAQSVYQVFMPLFGMLLGYITRTRSGAPQNGFGIGLTHTSLA